MWEERTCRIRGNRKRYDYDTQLRGMASEWSQLIELWREVLKVTFLCDRFQPRLSSFEVIHVSIWEWSDWHVALDAHSNLTNERFDEFGAAIGLPAYDKVYPDLVAPPQFIEQAKVEVLEPIRSAFESVFASADPPGLDRFQTAEFWDADLTLLHRVQLLA